MGSYLLVQISDIHLTADGSLPPGVRPRDNLVRGLRMLEETGIRPDVFLLTGDLADAGEPACYDDLATTLTAAAAEIGASVIYLPGNHDDRATFRRHLLGGTGDGPINQTHWRGGLRIIALDSTIPGEDGGALDDQTLSYLRSEISTAAPDGTVVALHHPPFPSPIQPMAKIALRDPERLRDAIAGSDVRIVLTGHNHHEALSTIGSIPVWGSPATAYRGDITSSQVFRKLPGSAFSQIDLSPARTTVTVLPITSGGLCGFLKRAAARASVLFIPSGPAWFRPAALRGTPWLSQPGGWVPVVVTATGLVPGSHPCSCHEISGSKERRCFEGASV
jgi:3',5'-cyclic AMP phosphodiesterase CpdA